MVEWGRPRKSGSQEGGMCEVGGEKDEEEKWTNKEGDELEDKSGDKKLHRIAKMRERRDRDLDLVKCIKMKMEKYWCIKIEEGESDWAKRDTSGILDERRYNKYGMVDWLFNIKLAYFEDGKYARKMQVAYDDPVVQEQK
ncbi:hypothetical protein H5410_037306 [Solanum commersonii]|uniref:Uncharacterized protein n=1 Tax=Solanum commersonii TaxID=4109 RepID=A0A9J5Y7M7_SOLCO|nr:hypothetical protein H5410_037306 [Solanum commersonii]